MNIKEILHGCEVGRIQTVGIMQMIPILSDIEETEYICPDQGIQVGTTSYGTMKFVNPTNNIAIIPSNTAYIVNKQAQNHCMTTAGIVNKNSTKSYDNACCIQSSQGGTIPTGDYEQTIIPFSLREFAISQRNNKDFRKLWGSIEQLNNANGLRASGHLELFYNAFNNELNTFVAQFENVPKQIGAIVLINGVVVGVERVPNYKYWEMIWKPLIRDCYGQLVIEYAKKHNLTVDNVLDIRTPLLHNTTINNIADIRVALSKSNNEQDEKAKEIVRSLLTDDFAIDKSEVLNDLTVNTITNTQFIGQNITRGTVTIYASLISTASYIKNYKHHNSKSFTI